MIEIKTTKTWKNGKRAYRIEGWSMLQYQELPWQYTKPGNGVIPKCWSNAKQVVVIGQNNAYILRKGRVVLAKDFHKIWSIIKKAGHNLMNVRGTWKGNKTFRT